MSVSGRGGNGCSKRRHASDRLLGDAGYDAEELVVLTVARYNFKTFSEPHGQAWMKAFGFARSVLGEGRGAWIACAVMDLVQEMRLSRRSTFWFSNPDCPGCANILCECERQLMGVVVALRRGRRSEAHTHAMLLCEGHDTSAFLKAAERLTNAMPVHPLAGGSAPRTASATSRSVH